MPTMIGEQSIRGANIDHSGIFWQGAFLGQTPLASHFGGGRRHNRSTNCRRCVLNRLFGRGCKV